GNIPAGSRLCVTGGKLSDSTLCDNTLNNAFVKVVWSATSGNISLTTDSGNVSLSITVTSALQPGSIDSIFTQQFIGYDSVPSQIFCSMPSGGGCSASYQFQWQQSANNLDWDDIDGSTSQDLSSPIHGLQQTTFFRRKTTEQTGGSVVYSNSCAVYVSPDPNDH
ncbi:MAG TPA: hypothetical protein VGC95_00265, partial [Chitinophagaceae bacterium]